MKKMGFPKKFNLMISLLFLNALVKIKVNMSLSKSFSIERGIRQGYLLILYLFLVIAEAMNFMITNQVELRPIKGIQLPTRRRQQIIAKYVDTSLTLFSEKKKYGTYHLYFGYILSWFWLKSSGH